MKKIITLALALGLLAGNAMAQQKQDGKKKDVADKIGLTEQQRSEIRKIHESERKEIEGLKADTSLTKQEQLTARKTVHEKYQAQLKNVLTPEQQKQAAELRGSKGMHGNGRDMMERKHGTDSLKRDHHRAGKQKHSDQGDGEFGKDLQLTEEQREAIKKNRAAFKQEADAIRNNKDLSKEEKQVAFRKLSEKQKQAMQSILTDDQKRKLESRKEKAPDHSRK